MQYIIIFSKIQICSLKVESVFDETNVKITMCHNRQCNQWNRLLQNWEKKQLLTGKVYYLVQKYKW